MLILYINLPLSLYLYIYTHMHIRPCIHAYLPTYVRQTGLRLRDGHGCHLAPYLLKLTGHMIALLFQRFCSPLGRSPPMSLGPADA